MNEPQGPLGTNDLLRPSLAAPSFPATALYSTTTGYITALLGGPLAAAIIVLLNSRRLMRLRKDWPIGVLAIPLTVLDLGLRLSGVPIILAAALSLGVFGLGYLLHRKHYRAMALMGLESPSGWFAGIAAIVLAFTVIVTVSGLVILAFL